MRKRKKGSTLITVLALSIIFMALGGIILTAIMGTMKSNTNQKIREDLKYAAESGLEIAKSYIVKNGYREAETEREINKNAEILTEAKTPKSNVTKMEIKLNPLKDDITDVSKVTAVEVVSKAFREKNGKKDDEQIKMKLKMAGGNNGNFMDHGLVGGDGGIQMNDQASANLEGTSISTGIGGIKYPIGSVNKPSENKNDFGALEFKKGGKRAKEITGKIGVGGEIKFDKPNGIGINEKFIDEVKIKITKEGNEIKTIIVGSSKDPREYIESLNEAIVKIEVVGGAIGEHPYSENPIIYIINSEKLKLEARGSINVINKIIINSGEMFIEGAVSLNMYSSTLIANKIESGMETSFNIHGQPNKVENKNYGVFSKEEETALNELINILIPNWKQNNTGGSNENLVMEEGSYE